MTVLHPRLGEIAHAAMRVAFGLLFFCHGAQKLFGLFGRPPAPAGSLLWFAGIIETAGGTLVALGLFAPVAALIASAEMAVAYVTSHAPNGTWPIVNGGELALLYGFAFLYLATRGAGRFSLDGLRR